MEKKEEEQRGDGEEEEDSPPDWKFEILSLKHELAGWTSYI